MLSIPIDPVSIEPGCSGNPAAAFRALATAAVEYLHRLDLAVASNLVSRFPALMTRVRGTGPGVSLGSLIAAIEQGFPLAWSCPFEGSQNVSGAVLTAAEALGEDRDDGFLFLRFDAGTRDLPLHVHPRSDRFIYAIGGRGFFHAAKDSRHLTAGIRHTAVRDRDVLMFRRGVAHTFSTADHTLTLLSYHRPFIPLDHDDQYTPNDPLMLPRDFLNGAEPKISFDAGWTCLV
jgi:hypothetical protein